MKKILPVLFSLFSLIAPGLLYAQSFSVVDTVYFSSAAGGNIFDTITNHTASGLSLKWHVASTNFPVEWQDDTVLGICDNNGCRWNMTGSLWNQSTVSGNSYVSAGYPPKASSDNFNLDLNIAGPGCGCGSYYMTLAFNDQNPQGTSGTTTFIVTKPCGTSVPATPFTGDIVLYPNPANTELNVVYGAENDVKNIALYNIIGKVMQVYKVSGASANLNLENIPSGIYFVRLYNGAGNVLVTRKFTKR